MNNAQTMKRVIESDKFEWTDLLTTGDTVLLKDTNMEQLGFMLTMTNKVMDKATKEVTTETVSRVLTRENALELYSELEQFIHRAGMYEPAGEKEE